MARWSPCRRTWTVRSSSSCPTGRRSTSTRCCASSAPGRSRAWRTTRTGSTRAAWRCPAAPAWSSCPPVPGTSAACCGWTTRATATAAVQRCRDLLDLDADPAAVDGRARRRPAARRRCVAGRARAAGARPRRRRRDRRPGRARPAGLGRRRAHRSPAGSSERYGKPLPAPHGRASTAPLPDRRRAGRRRPGGPADAASRRRALRGAGRGARRRRSSSTRRPTATRPSGGCSRCPASARGRLATCGCARSATPTCSCPPTSASGTRSTGSAGRPTRPPPAALAEAWRPWRSYALHAPLGDSLRRP